MSIQWMLIAATAVALGAGSGSPAPEAALLEMTPAGVDSVPIPLLPDTAEVRIALSAAPPGVAAGAAVWVLQRDGYERVRSGTNGYACLVERDHPESLAPLCYDPEGARTLLPGALEIARLRAGGLSYVAARDSVDVLYRTGALELPSRPVLSFMLSRHQRLYATPEGPAIGSWQPHVMIHYPGLSAEGFGLGEDDQDLILIQHDGAPTSYMVIPVARWSDGTGVKQ